MAEATVSRRDYYVYALFDYTGKPFYIGKGSGRRWRDHTTPGSLTETSQKNRVIKKTIQAIGSLPVVKVADGLSEDDAFFLERLLISVLQRRPHGPLTNGTDGGDGASGAIRSAEAKERYRKAAQKRFAKLSKEERSAAAARHLHSPEARAKRRAILTGKKKSESHRAKTSEAAKRRYERMSQEEKSNYIARIITPEARAKIRVALLGRKGGPRSSEWLANITAGLRRYHDSKDKKPRLCRQCNEREPGANGRCRTCSTICARELRAKKRAAQPPKPRVPRSAESREKQRKAMIAVWNRKGRSAICPRCGKREKSYGGYCGPCHANYERDRRRKAREQKRDWLSGNSGDRESHPAEDQDITKGLAPAYESV